MHASQSPRPAERRPTHARIGTSALGGGGALAIGLGAVALVWGVHRSYWHFLCDDAYISFRYARNLARHGELAFNVAPLERVEGYTNFLWVLLLAAGDVCGVAPERLAPLLCAASSLWVLWLVAVLGSQLRIAAAGASAAPADSSAEGQRLGPARQLAERMRGRLEQLRLMDLLGPLLLCTWPEFVAWSSGGLEGSLAVALGLRAWLAAREEQWAPAGGLAAAAMLTRPDSIIWILPLLLVDTLAARRRAQVGGLAIMLLTLGVPIGLHLLWRRYYYEAWAPNTWTVKQHGALLRDTAGIAYVIAWGRGVLLPLVSPLLLFARRTQVALLLALAAAVAYPWSVGGDFMAYGRLLLPASVLLALTVGALTAQLGVRLAARHEGAEADAGPMTRTSHRYALIAAALCTVWIGANAVRLPGRIAEDRAHAWLDGRFETVTAMDRFARIRIAAGRLLKERVPADTLVSVGAAGALPYASEVQVLDTLGLTDREVALVSKPRRGEDARPGHQLQMPASLLRARDPDLLCHAGTVGPRPRESSARKYGPYEWACIEIGAVEDPRTEDGWFDPGSYCCLKLQSRVVGTFGAQTSGEGTRDRSADAQGRESERGGRP